MRYQLKTANKIKVSKSSIGGRGVFATEDISEGEIIEECHFIISGCSKEMENKEGFNIQKSMYSWFLNKKKKGRLLVNIQSPKKTNILLKEAGIDPSKANEQLASKICEILGVEGIVSGSFETNKPMSGAAAVGLALIGIGGATQNATINLDIIHKDDELVVNYLKNIKGGLGSSTDDLINILMRKTARRIPYTK